MRNIKDFIIILYLLPLGTFAQEILTPPPARFITKFPFDIFSSGVIVVKANFENIPDTFNFILDTGSGGISLDSGTCVSYNIPMRKSDTTITGIGGVRKVSFVFDKTLHFPGLAVEHLNYHVNNYEVLTSVYGEKIDGIIGYSFFSRYIVKIDFDKQFIDVYSPGKYVYPQRGTLLHPIFTALPIVNLQIKDKKKFNQRFYFDTGAGLCFLMSERFVQDSSVMLQKRKPLVTQAEGMLGKLELRLTVIKELKLGPYRFTRVPTYLYDDKYNVTAYPFSGGLLGNDLLRRFNQVINYAQREIHLTPNTHFNDPFDYSYTGLGMYYIDGKIMVMDVIKNSPAEMAGLQPEDEVFGVGTNVSNNIQQYKNILQVPNQRIMIIIRRNSILQTLYLTTKSIL